MEIPPALHMNKGDGENSYAKNSQVQRMIISKGKTMLEEAVEQMLSCSSMIPEVMEIADLGCSSGPNTLTVISEIINVIHATCRNRGRPSPELRISLNDLPTNDFNYIFASQLPSFYKELEVKGSCFVSGIAGSFYGRLFPRKCLHFVHSSSSLHWLSQVPASLESNEVVNKGKLYISKSSPECVLEAYSVQFQKDFSTFLKSRSEELVHGGRMFLSFMGRRCSDPTTEESCYQWELLAQALMTMAREGIIEKEKIDSLNVPYYAPSIKELKLEIEKEGSFVINEVEALEIDWDGGSNHNEEFIQRGERVANTIRAVVESMLESHFGEHIMDELFERYAQLVGDYLSNNSTKYINFLLSLVRNHI
ncbi:jasmonate O-methyltransferase-like [Carica papaya]|uniref:jasmonate O-methyltransferase-like n=1 Tax=Carica papaya TaxID=3649 RepID=UPI000B8C9ECE|nr:jasmonate O-methyltransferase-like [Carica papaya]